MVLVGADIIDGHKDCCCESYEILPALLVLVALCYSILMAFNFLK